MKQSLTRREMMELAGKTSIAAGLCSGPALAAVAPVFNGHPVSLDAKGKILPWSPSNQNPYDSFLRMRWDFIKTKVPMSPGPEPRSSYPQYYFYCAFWDRNGKLEPDTWMNDVAEKVPNWFESARLYYAYTGDASVMDIARKLVDYAIDHGTSSPAFAWPNFPYTTTNAGDIEFRGFTNSKRFALHETQVGYGGDMGLTYYRIYLYSHEEKYLTAAVHVADTLAAHVRAGTATQAVWPDRVVMDTGRITADYGAHFAGCYMLLDQLIRANHGDLEAYAKAKTKVRDFLVQYPAATGYWADGHTDADVNSNTYKSNTAASNYALTLLDYPELDPEWRAAVPRLIKWTEDNFVVRSAPGEAGTQWGANIVGEQDSFLFKMDYQTARYAAECARWYAVSQEEAYKEKAFRSLNWVTYCNNTEGQGNESPLSKNISNWWSDVYGECPRMFYQVFAGIPEWAPAGQDHILYSDAVLKDVVYRRKQIRYEATQGSGTDYLRLSFRPTHVTLAGATLSPSAGSAQGYALKNIAGNDYSLTITRETTGQVIIQ